MFWACNLFPFWGEGWTFLHMTAGKLKVCSILWRSEVPPLLKLSSKRPRLVCESVSNSLLFSLSLPSKNKDIWEKLQAWSNSWDTNAIARQNDAFSLLPPPGAAQTLCREAIFFNLINIDWGERDSRNRLLQQHSRAFIRSTRRVPRVCQDVFTRLVAIAFHTESYKSTRDKQLTVCYILLMLLNIPDSVCLFDRLVCAYFKLTESPVW